MDYLMKVILLGDTYTGKTNLNNIYIKGDLPSETVNLPTIGVDFGCKELKLTNDITVKMQCWDTAGQECYRTIVRGYYRNVCGIILFFNLTNRESFNNLNYWLNELRTFMVCDHHHPILLLGTYKDKEENRVITKNEAIEYANNNNLLYFELSTYDYESIDLMFKTYLLKVYNAIKDKNCSGFKPYKKNRNIDVLSFEDNNINKQLIQKEPDEKSCCIIS